MVSLNSFLNQKSPLSKYLILNHQSQKSQEEIWELRHYRGTVPGTTGITGYSQFSAPSAMEINTAIYSHPRQHGSSWDFSRYEWNDLTADCLASVSGVMRHTEEGKTELRVFPSEVLGFNSIPIVLLQIAHQPLFITAEAQELCGVQ